MVRVRVALAIIVCASFASECLAQDNGTAALERADDRPFFAHDTGDVEF